MIKIRNYPIYTIEVYEVIITLNNKEYECRIHSGDSYTEVIWDNVTYSPEYPKLLEMEDQILEEFEKMMWKNE